jgi:GH35 family endo-1,4-beta-xylanase
MKIRYFLIVLCSLVGLTALASKYDKYGGLNSIKSEATGFFRLEQIEGRHYFITPEGHAFRSLGVNHFHQNIYQNRPEGTKPDDIHDEVIQNLHNMGYNAGGYQGPEWMRERIPYSLGITDMLLSSYWRPRVSPHPSFKAFTFEDVFDQAFLERLEEVITTVVDPVKDDSMLICYYFTDVPVIANANADGNAATLWANDGKDWMDFYEALPEDAPGKIKYHKWRKKNPDSDKKEFLGLVARQLYSNAHRIIRKHDKNHLIFGTRYHERDMPEYVVKEALPFLDGITLELRTQEFDSAFFDEVYKKYGKPIYLGDNITGAHQRIATYGPKEHLDYYERHLSSAMAHPHIVGYNRCQYQDAPRMMKPSEVKEGLLDVYGKYHDGIMPRLREINKNALKIGYNVDNDEIFYDGILDHEGEQLMDEARERIERIRKGDFKLRLVDEMGNPVEGKIDVQHVQHEFLFGTAMTAAFTKGYGATPKTTAIAKSVAEELFNVVTINCHWGLTEPEMGTYNWSLQDAMFDWADGAGLQARMHALIYMNQHYMPKWRDQIKSTEEWWKMIDQRIATVAERYGDRYTVYDVINETRYQTQFCEREAPLFPAYDDPETGARIFQIARKHLPEATLMPLEHFYPIFWDGDKDFHQYLDYCSSLIKLGAPVDAIGYQGHFHIDQTPFREGNQWGGPEAFTIKAVEKGLDHMAATLDKPIHITEFGPPSRNRWMPVEKQVGLSGEEVAAWSTNFYTMAFSKPYIKEITRWFIVDDVGGKGGVDAGLVTYDGKKKATYHALKKLLKEDWSTQWSGEMNNGQVAFRGFWGHYEIKVPGYQTARVSLLENGPLNQTIRLSKSK